MPLAFSP